MVSKNENIGITGLGVISSLGIGITAFWDALIKGKSGIVEIEEFDTSENFCHKAGLVNDFPVKEFLGEQEHLYGKTAQLAIACTLLALSDASIPLNSLKNKRVGIVLGTTTGESNSIEKMCESLFYKKTFDVEEAQRLPDNLIPVNVAHFLQIDAFTTLIPNACAAGNYAIAYASELLKQGRIDIAIAGGSDAFSRVAFTGFDRLMSLTPDVCRPFDKNRKGFHVGEGAGILIMEREEDAERENRSIYSTVLGYGLSCNAHHMTIPNVSGISKVVTKALDHSGIKPEQVDLVCAHGTGTPMNDKNECQALKEVFTGSLEHIPVIAMKSMLGHTMGAASAIEAIACIKAIHDSKIPPTINFETPDPDCPVDCVPNKMREAEVTIAVNNGFAFGGNNASVIFGKAG